MPAGLGAAGGTAGRQGPKRASTRARAGIAGAVPMVSVDNAATRLA